MVEAAVGPVRVVVPCVLFEKQAQVSLIPTHGPVEPFMADGV